MDTIRSVDTIFNKIHGIVNTIRSVAPFLTKSTVLLASSAVWTPFIYAIHGIMDTICSVDTIFNEIHGIVDTIYTI